MCLAFLVVTVTPFPDEEGSTPMAFYETKSAAALELR